MRRNKRKDYQLCSEIAERASKILGWDKATIFMDLSCLMEGGSIQLDLEGLRDANEYDLVHDVVGINHHLTRRNGELKDFFLPRYAK